ncbi:hypothetical protein HQ576_03735, partial [bacterium]|nr:hypothetical protein [bacterium]
MPMKKGFAELLLTRPVLATLLVALAYLMLEATAWIVEGGVRGAADMAVHIGVVLCVLSLLMFWLCSSLSSQHAALLESEKRGIAGMYA